PRRGSRPDMASHSGCTVSDQTPICSTCDRPIHDNAYLCHNCGHTLTKAMLHIVTLHSELDITLTRQARITTDNTGGIPEPLQDWSDAEPGVVVQPIPDPPIGPICTPTECKHESCTVVRWHIKDSEITHAAKFIAEHVWWLRKRPEAPEAFKDLTLADYRLERIIDRAEPRVYAGPCNICRKDLYARQGAAQVECHPCDMT